MTFPRQAAETLDELAGLRRRSRRSLGEPWFPLVCFGAVTVLSAPLVGWLGTSVLVPVWLVAGVVGMLLVRRHYRQRSRASGITGRSKQMWTIAVSMSLLCFAAGYGGGHWLGTAGGTGGPILIVLAGYVLLGWVQHNARPPLLVLPAAAVGIALALTGERPWLVTLVFGLLLVAAGAILRIVEHRGRS